MAEDVPWEGLEWGTVVTGAGVLAHGFSPTLAG